MMVAPAQMVAIRYLVTNAAILSGVYYVGLALSTITFATVFMLVEGRTRWWIGQRVESKLYPTRTDRALLMQIEATTNSWWRGILRSWSRKWWWVLGAAMVVMGGAASLAARVLCLEGVAVVNASMQFGVASFIMAMVAVAAIDTVRRVRSGRAFAGWNRAFEARFATDLFASACIGCGTMGIAFLVAVRVLTVGMLGTDQIGSRLMRRAAVTSFEELERIVISMDPNAESGRPQDVGFPVQRVEESADSFLQAWGWSRGWKEIVGYMWLMIPRLAVPAAVTLAVCAFVYLLTLTAWYGRGRVVVVLAGGIGLALLERIVSHVVGTALGSAAPGVIASVAILTITCSFIVMPQYLTRLVSGSTVACPSCEAETASSARFCPSCGTKLGEG